MHADYLYRVRAAVSDTKDLDFMVAAFDSTLPYLDSLGAGQMWGEQPFSQRKGFTEDIKASIKESENEQFSGTSVLIAEIWTTDAEHDPDPWRRIAAAIVRDRFPSYLTTNQSLAQLLVDVEHFLHLEVMVADCRSGAHRGGAGSAIINEVKTRGKAEGKHFIYTDCWAGNARKLNLYYKRQGFDEIADFSIVRNSGEVWPGTLLKSNSLKR